MRGCHREKCHHPHRHCQHPLACSSIGRTRAETRMSHMRVARGPTWRAVPAGLEEGAHSWSAGQSIVPLGWGMSKTRGASFSTTGEQKSAIRGGLATNPTSCIPALANTRPQAATRPRAARGSGHRHPLFQENRNSLVLPHPRRWGQGCPSVNA